jgi:hypothetical protein
VKELSEKQRKALTDLCGQAGIAPHHETDALQWCLDRYRKGQKPAPADPTDDPFKDGQAIELKAFCFLVMNLSSPRKEVASGAATTLKEMLKRRYSS